MKPADLPSPPLVHLPAGDATRRRWIGCFAKIGVRHLKDPHPKHPERERILRNQAEYRRKGIGEILDVGRSGWFIFRWEDGTEESQNKVDLDVFATRQDAFSSTKRLFPTPGSRHDS